MNNTAATERVSFPSSCMSKRVPGTSAAGIF